MRRVLVIGIGAGDPDHLTLQAVAALNRASVVFVVEKDAERGDLSGLRHEICARHMRGDYRTVALADPPRDRASAAYAEAVGAWRAARAQRWGEALRTELDEDSCGAFLVWGDPALYDSTIAVLEQISAAGEITLDYEVIPGISSVQALAAAHRIALNRVGEPIHVTTGRRLAAGDVPPGARDVIVMLDADCAFRTVADRGTDIYWGAYLSTPDEILIAGDVGEVAGEIVRVRTEARARKGWIMDTYLLRRR
jgi:precorrin-6A synthase